MRSHVTECRALDVAVNELDDIEREVLELEFAAGLAPGCIAEVLELSVPMVKITRGRALEKLLSANLGSVPARKVRDTPRSGEDAPDLRRLEDALRRMMEDLEVTDAMTRRLDRALDQQDPVIHLHPKGEQLRKTLVFLFPGQGAEHKGMGADLYKNFPVAREIYQEASDVLGYSALESSAEDSHVDLF